MKVSVEYFKEINFEFKFENDSVLRIRLLIKPLVVTEITNQAFRNLIPSDAINNITETTNSKTDNHQPVNRAWTATMRLPMSSRKGPSSTHFFYDQPDLKPCLFKRVIARPASKRGRPTINIRSADGKHSVHYLPSRTEMSDRMIVVDVGVSMVFFF